MTLLEPMHPGLVLRELYMEPAGLSAYRLAKEIDVPQQRIADLVAGRRGISADTALRLGQYFFADAERGARVFLGMQSRYEVRAALVDLRPVLEAIAPRPDAVEARAAVLKLADAVESPA